MSTRSFIAMETDSGYRAVYCHSNGYPSWNGRVLHQHYTDPAKLTSLLDLGHLSWLGTGLGERHNFQDRYDEAVTTAYGRDRGDKDCEAEQCPNLADLIQVASDMGAVYLYVFSRAGEWLFTPISWHGSTNPLMSLVKELETIGAIENVS